MKMFKKVTAFVITAFMIVSLFAFNVVPVMAEETGVETIYYHDYDASKDVNMTAENGWIYDESCWEGSPNGIRLKYKSGSKNVLRYNGDLGKNYTIEMTVTGGMTMLYGYFWLNVPENATFDGTNFSDGWKMYNNGSLTGYTGGTGAYSGEVMYASTTGTDYNQINKAYTKFKISLTMKDDGQTLVYTLKSNDGATIATSGDIDLTNNGAWSYLKDTTGGFAIRNSGTDGDENYFIIIHDLKITKPIATEYTVYEHDYDASKDVNMTSENGWIYDESCWEGSPNGIRLKYASGSKNVLRYNGDLGKNYTIEMTVTGGLTMLYGYFWLNVPENATFSDGNFSDGWRIYNNGELFGFSGGGGKSKGTVHGSTTGTDYNQINKAYTKFKILLTMKDDGQTLVYTLKSNDGATIATSGDIDLTKDGAWSYLKDTTGGFAIRNYGTDGNENYFIIIHNLKITKPVLTPYDMTLECTENDEANSEISYITEIAKFGHKIPNVVIGVYDASKNLIGVNSIATDELITGINNLNGCIKYDSTKEPQYIKAFMWENFKTLTPLCISPIANVSLLSE